MMKRYWILFMVLVMALSVAAPAMAGRGGNDKPPKAEPTRYNVTMEFAADDENGKVDGLSTMCVDSMEMVGTTRRGQLTLESDDVEIYIRAPSVYWEREYPFPSGGYFDGCHGPSINPPGDGGHLWIHFLADGTIELYWHFDYYFDDNGEKGRSRETVRQHFSMAAFGAYADAPPAPDDMWEGKVHLGWFLVENGKVITDGYEPFPPSDGTDMSFTLTVTEVNG